MSDLEAEIARLRAENARLAALLERHGIACHGPAAPPVTVAPAPELPPVTVTAFTSDDKIALFRRLFHGRTDVYPVRWESKAGKSGYAPACANEWRTGVCEKPRIKCADCGNRLLIPLSDQTVYDHLAGQHTIGVYPLLLDDTCYFLAVDFDGDAWREDVRAFAKTARGLDLPVALEISRSGNGAHAWIIFSSPVLAREARALGTALISCTCKHTRQLKLSSYDRMFPNQDRLPKGGFGNLIALPLQKKPREQGYSVFVDDELIPYPDPWAFLASLRPMAPGDLETAILRSSGGAHPLDVAFVDEEEQAEPWKRPDGFARQLPGPNPERLTATLANQIYLDKEQLPQPLMNRLIRLAAFQNPEFYKAQAMRFSVWDKPRVIGCAENYPRHIALPRGCLDAVCDLLRDNDIALEIRDERYGGVPISVTFGGTLHAEQERAVREMAGYDTGVLCAPTAFGKTVVAAAMIARRGVNTLILVHRTELLRQWQQRLQAFLGTDGDIVGTIGGGKRKATGKIDIAVMQSLSRKGEISDLVESYGQIIVDECHHLSALSFEAVLKRARARYVLGLTATPVRRDGQHPIIFMQCGPIRHSATRKQVAPHSLAVIPRYVDTRMKPGSDVGIQEVFRVLATDSVRTDRISADVVTAYRAGRRIIVLTERTYHLEALQVQIQGDVENLFVLHGRMSRKRRASLIEPLEALAADVPRVLLATGKLVGEGLDHPPLDTLFLALPISWKGTLQQYAGRLHREHATKSDVRIYDYVDTGHPVLMRMWQRRQRGYRAMGYRISESSTPVHELG